jgi:hypothetical protein
MRFALHTYYIRGLAKGLMRNHPPPATQQALARFGDLGNRLGQAEALTASAS